MSKMLPRDGTNFSTTYLKQTLEQRKEFCRHIKQVITEISNALEDNLELNSFVRQPLKGFKTTQGVNRSIMVIIEDMCNEAKGKKKDGLPKDFALAPIERWNKLFEGTDYAVDLIQTYNTPNNVFTNLMEFDHDTI